MDGWVAGIGSWKSEDWKVQATGMQVSHAPRACVYRLMDDVGRPAVAISVLTSFGS